MSCHKRADVRVFLDLINPLIGVEFGEAEWHAVCGMTEAVTGDKLSRRQADQHTVTETAIRLSHSLVLLPEQEERLLVAAEGPHRESTVKCLNLIATNGLIATVDLILTSRGVTVARDFLGRHVALDNSWMIEKTAGDKPGTLGGWVVTSPRQPDIPATLFSTLAEAKQYVQKQPSRPFPGSRRREREAGILTIGCPKRHISNHYREDGDLTHCPTCGTDLSHLPIQGYNITPPITPAMIETYFDNIEETEKD